MLSMQSEVVLMLNYEVKTWRLLVLGGWAHGVSHWQRSIKGHNNPA